MYKGPTFAFTHIHFMSHVQEDFHSLAEVMGQEQFHHLPHNLQDSVDDQQTSGLRLLLAGGEVLAPLHFRLHQC